MTEQHAERRLIKHRLVGSCGLVARSRPRFSPAVSFELGGKGGFIAAVRPNVPVVPLMVPLGLNSVPIQSHCSFIGRCPRYFIRP
ncbi:hypothetical protein T03_13944 [Trichinella britovi]|uniref:Uncharacterized protein n=1 Tax=Trichinella britovi TaxID=45882 RepID=A0A0V1AH24_TRIBR|nr:hypothetical protein T03_13944 [Trichinella britovi]